MLLQCFSPAALEMHGGSPPFSALGVAVAVVVGGGFGVVVVFVVVAVVVVVAAVVVAASLGLSFGFIS